MAKKMNCKNCLIPVPDIKNNEKVVLDFKKPLEKLIMFIPKEDIKIMDVIWFEPVFYNESKSKNENKEKFEGIKNGKRT